MREDDTVQQLKDARDRRRRADEEGAQARADIARLIVEYLRANPDVPREEVAELADVSPTTVRDLARAAGIPARKPGGPGRRRRAAG
jgi:phage terminase Nu1 subunit (DNA packaging protein)